jgi:hypothetical protein
MTGGEGRGHFKKDDDHQIYYFGQTTKWRIMEKLGGTLYAEALQPYGDYPFDVDFENHCAASREPKIPNEAAANTTTPSASTS